jgi:uncharacterized protein YceK
MRTTIASFVLALVVLTSGCGTVRNLAGPNPEPYGGVVKDVEFLNTPGSQHLGTDGKGGVLFCAAWAADVCVSGVMDTLTWPYVFIREGVKRREDRAAFEDPVLTAQGSCEASPSDGGSFSWVPNSWEPSPFASSPYFGGRFPSGALATAPGSTSD